MNVHLVTYYSIAYSPTPFVPVVGYILYILLTVNSWCACVCDERHVGFTANIHTTHSHTCFRSISIGNSRRIAKYNTLNGEAFQTGMSKKTKTKHAYSIWSINWTWSIWRKRRKYAVLSFPLSMLMFCLNSQLFHIIPYLLFHILCNTLFCVRDFDWKTF